MNINLNDILNLIFEVSTLNNIYSALQRGWGYQSILLQFLFLTVLIKPRSRGGSSGSRAKVVI